MASKPLLDVREKVHQRYLTKSWGKNPDAFPDTDDMMVLTKKQQSQRYKQLLTSLKKKKK